MKAPCNDLQKPDNYNISKTNRRTNPMPNLKTSSFALIRIHKKTDCRIDLVAENRLNLNQLWIYPNGCLAAC